MWKTLLLAVCLTLSGCGATIDDYHGTKPQLDIFNWFAGTSQAWGMVQDFSGKQVRRFTVAIHGTVEGDTLTLNEKFIFDDGEKQTRTWHIRRLADGSYAGNAADIIGTAKGRSAGNAFNWQYAMMVKTDSGSYKLSFDDWIFQQDASHLMNVTLMKKMGIEVARVTLFFSKTSGPGQ